MGLPQVIIWIRRIFA
uniref:Uncharacterized protein n=1 Tax=Rhizophora mucronata TaxID=61149 RepID=A0A2P2QGI0_RHIMU